MPEVIRSPEEITKMKQRLEAELTSLPDTNLFGDSNAEAKAELREWIASLNTYQSSGALPVDEYNEIRGWLTGASWSTWEHDYS